MDIYQRLQAVMGANDDRTFYAARRVFELLETFGIRPGSAVDFGCGGGAWLAQAKRVWGTDDILGIDGTWTRPELLRIPQANFAPMDLTRPIHLGRRYDIAFNLEVAEHLAIEHESTLLDSIVRHAPVVVFSAAIPGQGGVGHVNERWPDYWAARFAERGFACLDIFRDALWDDAGVDMWYKQNLLLFMRVDRLASLSEAAGAIKPCCPRRLVHPDLFAARCGLIEGDLVFEHGGAGGRTWTFDRRTGAEILAVPIANPARSHSELSRFEAS